MSVLFRQTSSGAGYFISATIGLIIASFMSAIDINLPGGSVSMLLLPLLIVSLWPRGVNSAATILMFFCMGLFMDWGTNGALGQWALIYLTVFAVLRPDRRDGAVSFLGTVGLWCVGLFIGVIMLIVTGWFVYKTAPNFTILFRQALLVSFMMPLVVGIRHSIRYFLTDPYDRDYL